MPPGGSSPLVRGKRVIPWRRENAVRIIPACAGQTCWSFPAGVRIPDHPRLCGANRAPAQMPLAQLGSSPLVRGKRKNLVNGGASFRIIPACAGQTYRFLVPLGPNTDHPRLCGANLREATACALPVGSSPLVRGKPVRRPGAHSTQRIIPACAGQTPRGLGRLWVFPDHPRLCGANDSSD